MRKVEDENQANEPHELVNDLKLTDIPSGMMTAAGAQDLRSRLTPFGQRFVRYIRA